MDNQQGPTIQHSNPAQWYVAGSLNRRGVFGEKGYIKWKAESLCCVAETIATLLIAYTPI